MFKNLMNHKCLFNIKYHNIEYLLTEVVLILKLSLKVK